MAELLRNRRRPAVPLLVLIFAAPIGADAQQFVCRPIVRGDTVSGLARELTGSARAAYTDAFQIRDPARQMFVPKSQYRRPLRTQWEACVATTRVDAPLAWAPIVAAAGAADAAGARAEPSVTSAAMTIPPAPSLPGPAGGSLPGVIVIAGIGSVVMAMLLIGAAFSGPPADPIPPDLQQAGEEFVVAFARPLIDSSSSVPPIEARLRFIQRAQQLEISIAPGGGRRYPNLVDHMSNVEYDVKRVMQVIGTHVVVSGRLRASGRWVVVPIHLSLPAEAATAESDQRRLAEYTGVGAT